MALLTIINYDHNMFIVKTSGYNGRAKRMSKHGDRNRRGGMEEKQKGEGGIEVKRNIRRETGKEKTEKKVEKKEGEREQQIERGGEKELERKGI